MATATDRGWGHPPAPRTVLVKCEGIPLRLRPEVAPLFAELITRVEAIRGPGWMVSAGGANLRPVRGYEKRWADTGDERFLSNHSWGLAADFRAGTNPMQARLRTDMPPGIGDIAAACGLAWGGTWKPRRDPMHFEFVGTPADARAAVARLNAEHARKLAHQEDDDMTPEQDARQRRIEEKLDDLLTQAGRTGRPDAPNRGWSGWPQLGGRTVVDALAAVMRKVGA